MGRRRLLWSTVLADLKGKVAGSALGILWLLLYPVLFLGAYAVIYLFVFRIRFDAGTPAEYILMIFCGLIPFLASADAISTSTVSVTGNPSLVKNTMYPIDLVPAKASLVSQNVLAVGLVMIMVALVFFGRLTIFFPGVFIVWAFQIIFLIGLGWILAAANVIFRDLQQVIGLVVLILMMISPIAYTIDMIPPSLQTILSLNPLYYFIISYQELAFFGRMPPTEVYLPMIVISVLTFVVGAWFFGRLKPAFSDHV